MKPLDNGLVHIVCGDSAAGTLHLAKQCAPDSVLVQHDVLSCGPLTEFGSLAEWCRLRRDFWSSLCGVSLSCDQRHDLIDNAPRLRDAPGIVLWLGGGLSDQLLLPSTLRISELAGNAQPPLRAIEFMHHRKSGGTVVGIGELTPDDLVEHPEPSLILDRDLPELRRVWKAMTAPTPEGLLAYLQQCDVAFPRLQRALGALLMRFPDVNTGLSEWDAELLRNSLEWGPDSIHIVARTIISQCSRLDPVGDTYLLWRLRRLGDPSLAHPPLRLRDEGSSTGRFEVGVTPAGEDIIKGHRNFAHLNGIDDWIAGIHLQSSQNRIWFRQGSMLIAQARG